MLRIDQHQIVFHADVLDTLSIEGKIVVLFKGESPSGDVNPRNVECYSPDGENVWEVERPSRDAGHLGEPVFKSIYRQDGQLYASNWNKYEYEIDTSDGSISEQGRVMK